MDQPIPGVAPELPTDDETGTAGTPDRPRSLGFLPAGAPTGNNNALVYLALVLAGAGVLVGQQLFSRFGIQLLLRT